jgi:hypothetical protein
MGISSTTEPKMMSLRMMDLERMYLYLKLCPVPERDWSLISDVNRKFDDIRLKTCNVCNERWVDLDLKSNGQCGRCDKATRRNQVNMFSAANFMDPEEFPAHLPELDDTEEMLIARCHVHVEVQRYRGAQ